MSRMTSRFWTITGRFLLRQDDRDIALIEILLESVDESDFVPGRDTREL